MENPDDLRKQLEAAAPPLWGQVHTLVAEWLDPVIKRLDARAPAARAPKSIHDPVWGNILLYPWELELIDSPLMQRLRGVYQLGMAHLVYPGATHSRFAHSIGTLEAAERMMRALEVSADVRKSWGGEGDKAIKPPDPKDRLVIRLAAVLHDIGHGPYSHATEPIVQAAFSQELDAVQTVLRKWYAFLHDLQPSEILASLMVLSRPMGTVFEHGVFAIDVDKHRLALEVVARMVGSVRFVRTSYLSRIVSGDLDADKLDYMARDAWHSGLPVALDISRLISKLEVISGSPEEAPTKQFKDAAEASKEKRFYVMGVSSVGLSSYEQLVISRVFLYDRLYYHQKVRCAEAMLRTLLRKACSERGKSRTLRLLYTIHGDQATLAVFSGAIEVATPDELPVARALHARLSTRSLYHRAYAFGYRLVAGLDKLPEGEDDNTRSMIWQRITGVRDTPGGLAELALRIKQTANRIANRNPACATREVRREDVIVDLPLHRVVAGSRTLLTRTPGNLIQPPRLSFNSEQWSKAYEHQKLLGYVFAPLDVARLVACAAAIVFFEEFTYKSTTEGTHICKLPEEVPTEWFVEAARTGVCSAETAEALTTDRVVLVHATPKDIEVPEEWLGAEVEVRDRLAREFRKALASGLPAGTLRAVLATLKDVCAFVAVNAKSGEFATSSDLKEVELQSRLRDHLRSRGSPCREGEEIGGGETDLVVHDTVVVENKVRRGPTRTPFEIEPNYAWQGRRYLIAVCQRVVFVVMGYSPADEGALLDQPGRVHVLRVETKEGDSFAQVRIAIPFGHGHPSRAKAPN